MAGGKSKGKTYRNPKVRKEMQEGSERNRERILHILQVWKQQNCKKESGFGCGGSAYISSRFSAGVYLSRILSGVVMSSSRCRCGNTNSLNSFSIAAKSETSKSSQRPFFATASIW